MLIKSISAAAARRLVKSLANRAAEHRREARELALKDPVKFDDVAQYLRMMAHAYAMSAKSVADWSN